MGDYALPVLGNFKPEETMEPARQGLRCIYCWWPFSDEDRATRDHIVARACGGTDSADNITLACRSCNSSNGTKEAVQFYLSRESQREQAAFFAAWHTL